MPMSALPAGGDDTKGTFVACVSLNCMCIVVPLLLTHVLHQKANRKGLRSRYFMYAFRVRSWSCCVGAALRVCVKSVLI